MSDLVERLRVHSSDYGMEWLEEAADRIEQLEAENASLASWQCEFTDGKTGPVYGQGGTTFCIMARRMQQLEAEAKTRTLDYLGQVGQLSEELERVRAALREIEYMDRPQVRGQPQRVSIQEKARAALEERT